MNTGSSQRQQRLALALRANLRRRKGQASDRADDSSPASDAVGDEALPTDEGPQE